MSWVVTRLLMAFREAQMWGGNAGHAMGPALCLIPAQCVQFPNNYGSGDTQGLLLAGTFVSIQTVLVSKR